MLGTKLARYSTNLPERIPVKCRGTTVFWTRPFEILWCRRAMQIVEKVEIYYVNLKPVYKNTFYNSEFRISIYDIKVICQFIYIHHINVLFLQKDSFTSQAISWTLYMLMHKWFSCHSGCTMTGWYCSHSSPDIAHQ